MANGPQDYRDPKVTTTGRGSSMNWLWYVLGALLILLLLAWILGLFAADEDAAAVSTDPAATEETTIEEPVTDGAAATEGGATGGATAGDAATDAAD